MKEIIALILLIVSMVLTIVFTGQFESGNIELLEYLIKAGMCTIALTIAAHMTKEKLE